MNKPDLQGISPLHRAIDNGNLEIVKLMIKKNTNLNHADSSGWTPLHIAAMHNDLEMVKILVHKGANMNAKDFCYNTPLAFARQNNAKEVSQFLRKIGAKEFSLPLAQHKKPFFDDIKNFPKKQTIFNF